MPVWCWPSETFSRFATAYYFSCHVPGLPGKRPRRDKEQSPLISKRQCPETTPEDSEASTSSLWEILPTQITSLFCAPSSKGLDEEMGLAGSSSGSLTTTEIKNQEVKSKLGLRIVRSLF